MHGAAGQGRQLPIHKWARACGWRREAAVGGTRRAHPLGGRHPAAGRPARCQPRRPARRRPAGVWGGREEVRTGQAGGGSACRHASAAAVHPRQHPEPLLSSIRGGQGTRATLPARAASPAAPWRPARPGEGPCEHSRTVSCRSFSSSSSSEPMAQGLGCWTRRGPARAQAAMADAWGARSLPRRTQAAAAAGRAAGWAAFRPTAAGTLAAQARSMIAGGQLRNGWRWGVVGEPGGWASARMEPPWHRLQGFSRWADGIAIRAPHDQR